MDIAIRRLRLDDAESLAESANHPEIAGALRVDFPSPYKIEHARAFITSATTIPPPATIAITQATSDNVVGIISLSISKPADSTVLELGYWLRPNLWNRGFISRAIALLLKPDFLNKLWESGSLPSKQFRVEAIVAVKNVHSGRALLRNNFCREGRLRDYNICKTDSDWREDAYIFAKSISLLPAPEKGYVQGNFVDREEAGPTFKTRFRMEHVMEVDLLTGKILRIEPQTSPWAIILVKTSSTYWLWQSTSLTSFITPGFIDTHVHAPQYSFMGTATDRPLMGSDGWLETYTFPAESRLSDSKLARRVYEVSGSETLWLSPVTTLSSNFFTFPFARLREL